MAGNSLNLMQLPTQNKPAPVKTPTIKKKVAITKPSSGSVASGMIPAGGGLVAALSQKKLV